MIRVLVVEDDALIAVDLVQTVEAFGGDVIDICSSAAGALRMVERHRPDVVLMDIRLGADDGIEAARLIRQRHDIGIVFVSGSTDPETIRRVDAFGSAPFVSKPVDDEALRRAILTAKGDRRYA